jgi:hypothetical protein
MTLTPQMRQAQPARNQSESAQAGESAAVAAGVASVGYDGFFMQS